MITITNAQLIDTNLESALRMLNNHRGFDIKTSYNIGRIISRVEKKIKLAREERVKYLMDNCEREEDGKVKLNGGQIVMKEPDKAEKEIAAFLEASHDVDVSRINLEDIKDVKITPAELMALEPVLFRLEAVESAKP